jgi:hypothetical protein
MVFRRSQEPSIRPPRCPRTADCWGVVDDCLAPRWCKWIATPVVWSVEGLICGDGKVDSRRAKKVERVLDLGGQSIPQLQGEIGIGCRNRCDECIFERLYGTFSGVDVMVVWFNQLQFTFVVGKELFDIFCGLIERIYRSDKL